MLAVLITCHNRKKHTLACLEHLYSQALPLDVAVRVYLVDDGCTDGTREAVLDAHPDVFVIQGDGSLFWCNGMRLAWSYAAQADPDYYFWLNDDTFLRSGALAALLAIHRQAASAAGIVVGSCCDPSTGKQTYGGHTRRGRHPGRLFPVAPDPESSRSCDTFNGNCVLVPRATFQVAGMMRAFKHAIGDIDYGLLAGTKGVRILVAPGYVAECSAHRLEDTWHCRELPRKQRWRLLLSRVPPGDWWKVLWTHAGMRALLYWPLPYARVLLGL